MTCLNTSKKDLNHGITTLFEKICILLTVLSNLPKTPENLCIEASISIHAGILCPGVLSATN